MSCSMLGSRTSRKKEKFHKLDPIKEIGLKICGKDCQYICCLGLHPAVLSDTLGSVLKDYFWKAIG